MEEHTYHGEWWLPSDPENRIAGILTYTPNEGGELDLFESLDDHVDPLHTRQVETIYGDVVEGENITLKDCVVTGGKTRFGPTKRVKQTYKIRQIFVGAHLDSLHFDQVKFSFPNLEAWADMNMITTKLSQDPQNIETSIDHANPVTVDMGEWELSLKMTPSTSTNHPKGIEYKQKSWFTIEPEDTISYENCRDALYTIQNLFSLAFNTPVYPREVIGLLERDDDFPDHEVEILYEIPRYEEPVEIKHSGKIHFSRTDIEFEDAIKTWFEHSTEVETFHDLYFSLIYDQDMYLQYEFISLAIAIEAYHKHLFPNDRPMDQDKFKEFFDGLIEGIPDEIPVKKRIDNLEPIVNDYSFREKTEAVANEYRGILDELLDIGDVVGEITATRHGIVHALDMESDSRAASKVDDLAPLTYRLRVIIEACLYKEIGLNDRQIVEILEKKHSWALSR